MAEIRPYAPSDRDAVLALHAQYGPGEFFADPEDARQAHALVLERAGEVYAFGVSRRTIEAFMLVDRKKGSPQERWNAVNGLLDTGLDLLGDEYGELHLATGWPAFGKRLAHLPRMVYDPRIHFVRVLGGGGYGA